MDAAQKALEAGYGEVLGAFSVVNGRKVTPYRSSASMSVKPDQTYTIGMEDLVAIVNDNPDLQDMVYRGLLQYVDGHLVLNDPEFIDRSGDKVCLTEYARKHIEQCCVVFTCVSDASFTKYAPALFYNFTTAPFNIKLEYKDHFQAYSRSKRQELDLKWNMHFNLLMSKLNQDYVECIVAAMQDRGYNEAKIVNLTGLNKDTISNTIQRKSRPKPLTLALICLALKLPYTLSLHIITCASCGYDPAHNNDDNVIDFALKFLYDRPLRRGLQDDPDSVEAFFNAHGIFLSESYA